MVPLPSAYTDLDLGFPMRIFMEIEFIKRPFICDRLFSMDINDTQIFLSQCWKLITGWQIWDCINDLRDFQIFIIQ